MILPATYPRPRVTALTLALIPYLLSTATILSTILSVILVFTEKQEELANTRPTSTVRGLGRAFGRVGLQYGLSSAAGGIAGNIAFTIRFPAPSLEL